MNDNVCQYNCHNLLFCGVRRMTTIMRIKQKFQIILYTRDNIGSCWFVSNSQGQFSLIWKICLIETLVHYTRHCQIKKVKFSIIFGIFNIFLKVIGLLIIKKKAESRCLSQELKVGLHIGPSVLVGHDFVLRRITNFLQDLPLTAGLQNANWKPGGFLYCWI